jgi:hypothetical protein
MSFIRDGVALFGVGLVLYGIAQWSMPLTCVVGGGLLTCGALAWSTFARKRRET